MSSNISSFEGKGFMTTKIEGGRWTPLVPSALNLTFEGQKRLPTVDSISLSFKTLLSLVEKLFGQYVLCHHFWSRKNSKNM